MTRYPNLFKPLKVRNLILKNRIMAAPVGSINVTVDYYLDHLAAKARGGACLITIGSCPVDDERANLTSFSIGFTKNNMALLFEILSVIKQNGAKASIELIHAGQWANYTKKNPIGPVEFVREDGIRVEAMDEKMMEEVAANYAKAALEAKSMGFDMCMLHFAHGWLPAQFLSPLFNKRTDKYGGSFENRIRFPMMIVERVREAVGSDFPIEMRISGEEWIEGGIKLEEVIEFLRLVQDKIDLVHVSSGVDKILPASVHMITTALAPHLYNVHLSEKVKKAVKIPVVTVGAITNPDEAERIIEEGKADAVALGRALLADPEWPNKARYGRADEIRPCIRCLSCYHVATNRRKFGCTVNPRMGREHRLGLEIKPSTCKKHIVVVGGGPAGINAALVAAERGHKVTLVEKESELGGKLICADYDDLKIDLRRYKEYLVKRINNSKVTVILNTEATPENIKKLNPDAIIVAVGAVPLIPTIPGINSPKVIQAVDAYKKIDQMGRKIVIIGGGQVGCELGVTLAKTGREVTIIEQASVLAAKGNIMYREALRQLMESQSKLSWITEARCKAIINEGVIISKLNGEEKILEADNIICAIGFRPLIDFAESFIGIAENVIIVGDCLKPRELYEAVHEGFFSTLNL